MEILKIAGIGILACILCVYTAKDNKDISLLISLCAGIVIITFSLNYLSPAVSILNSLDSAGIVSSGQLAIIMKIIVTAYIAQFASDICEDAGQKSISSKIELAAKIIIIYLSMPILISLFDYLTSLV